MNYVFRLEEWLDKYYPQLYNGRFYFVGSVTSPGQLCDIEHFRKVLVNEFDWGVADSVDVFVMSLGEPSNRWNTKIGGLPYRRRSMPWPTNASGKPLTFIAQFDFSDSRDIVGSIPEDILLIFGDNEQSFLEPTYFEWTGRHNDELIPALEVPPPYIRIAPCFGNIARYECYPTAVKLNDEETLFHGHPIRSAYQIPRLYATQIGSSPFLVHSNISLPGRILCTLAPVAPDFTRPFPWVNKEVVSESEQILPYLHSLEGSCLYICIEVDGKLTGVRHLS